MRSAIKSARRLEGFEKPTVWSIMTPLAIETKSVNLVSFLIYLGARSTILESAKILSRFTHKSPQNQLFLLVIQIAINTLGLLAQCHL